MDKHEIIHKVRALATHILEAKSYSTSYYAREHLDTAYTLCNQITEHLGKQLISETEEKV